MVQSLSRVGQCWDNSVAESWFATYKTELIYHRAWPTISQLRTATFDYIEVFYNRQRRHSSLGGLSPARYEQSRQPAAAQAV
jgi:transposase InsO family protein